MCDANALAEVDPMSKVQNEPKWSLKLTCKVIVKDVKAKYNPQFRILFCYEEHSCDSNVWIDPIDW